MPPPFQFKMQEDKYPWSHVPQINGSKLDDEDGGAFVSYVSTSTAFRPVDKLRFTKSIPRPSLHIARHTNLLSQFDWGLTILRGHACHYEPIASIPQPPTPAAAHDCDGHEHVAGDGVHQDSHVASLAREPTSILRHTHGLPPPPSPLFHAKVPPRCHAATTHKTCHHANPRPRLPAIPIVAPPKHGAQDLPPPTRRASPHH
ncbi:hypothetical protein EDB84DRAFT_1640998 [Lactarius hengduanensis]|nr:hypothetical protein EDB84DRAFT_1640998 [Lactarius hengduanensis]